MSMERTCCKCGLIEGIRFNFGSNIEAERDFHNEDWHNCDECDCEGNVKPDGLCVCSLKAMHNEED